MDAGERLARLEERMIAVAEDVDAVIRELGSIRDPGTIRGRLHGLEGDAAAAKTASAALDAAKRERSKTGERRWTRGQALFYGACAVFGLAPGWIALLAGKL